MWPEVWPGGVTLLVLNLNTLPDTPHLCSVSLVPRLPLHMNKIKKYKGGEEPGLVYRVHVT